MYFVYPQETNLRATQYLPDIVRLQQCLYDSFHHRLDQKEARRMTIGDFLQSRKHGENSANLGLGTLLLGGAKVARAHLHVLQVWGHAPRKFFRF